MKQPTRSLLPKPFASSRLRVTLLSQTCRTRSREGREGGGIMKRPTRPLLPKPFASSHLRVTLLSLSPEENHEC